MNEQVLVVPRRIMEPFVDPATGMSSPYLHDKIKKVILAKREWMDRDAADDVNQCQDMVQIIPYVMVRHRGKYLYTHRKKKQKEARLHHRYSLGISGHIDRDAPGDPRGGTNLISGSLWREMREELKWSFDSDLDKEVFLGAIYDPGDEVSSLHFGLAYLVESETKYISSGEPDKMTVAWVSPDYIAKKAMKKLELWSQILASNCISINAR